MKKISFLATAVAVSCVCLLAACSSGNAGQSADSPSSASSSPSSAAVSSADGEPSPSTSSPASPSAQSPASPSASQSSSQDVAASSEAAGNSMQKKDTDFELGHYDGDKYVNEDLGFSFTLPEGWAFSTDAHRNITGAATSSEKSEMDSIASHRMAWEMVADQTEGSHRDNIMLTYGIDPTVSGIDIDTLTGNIISDVESQSAGQPEVADMHGESSKVSFCGESVTAAKFEFTNRGIECTQLIVPFVRGDDAVSLTFTCYDEDNTEELLSCFSAN